MASQVYSQFCTSQLEVLKINNSHNVNAVAVYRDVIVGHILFNLAPRLSAFLRRDVNKVFAEVAGAKVNRGEDYGL